MSGSACGPRLGKYGVWGMLGFFDDGRAAEIERLGYGALWIGGVFDSELAAVERALEQTTNIPVAAGVVNIWTVSASDVSQTFRRFEERFPGRFFLGVGAGAPEFAGDRYRSPYEAVVDYLGALERNGVPKDRIVLGALRKRMLELSASRGAGAHPYLTPVRHTAFARGVLGSNALLAPEHKVVFNVDPAAARETGRTTVDFYLKLSNYVNMLKEFGFPGTVLGESAPDELVDALVSHGSIAQIASGLRAHLKAGADHVAIHPLSSEVDLNTVDFTTVIAEGTTVPAIEAAAARLLPRLAELAVGLGLQPRAERTLALSDFLDFSDSAQSDQQVLLRDAKVITEYRVAGRNPFHDNSVLLLTTTGAKSGLKRTTPLSYYDIAGRRYVVSYNTTQSHKDSDPAWVYNLRADPIALVEVDGQTLTVIAREVIDPQERQRVFETVLADLPEGFDAPKARRGYVPFFELVRQAAHN